MKPFICLLFFLLLPLSLWSIGSVSDTTRVVCAAPKSVYLNDSFRIVYLFYGDGEFQAPDFGVLKEAGPIISKITEKNQPTENRYTYMLVAKKPGELRIPSAVYCQGGKRIESEPLTIQVLDEEKKPDVLFEVDTINSSADQMLVTYPMKVPLNIGFTIDYSLNDTVADFYSFERMEKVKSEISIFSDFPKRESFSDGFEFIPFRYKEDRTISYTYRCFPQKTGSYQVPPAIWYKDGREILRSKPLTIEIVEPTDEWKSFFIRREVESTNVPLLEAFQVVYKLYTKYTNLNMDDIKPKFPDSQIEYLPIPKDLECDEVIYEGEEYYTFTILKIKVTPLTAGIFEGGAYTVTCSPKGASHLRKQTMLPAFQYYVYKNLLK